MGDVIVGIDLGTTGYSVVVYSPDGGPEPLADSDALYRTPCYVAYFPDTNEIVGLRAKQREKENQNFVIYEPKRLIGRCFSDLKVQVLIPFLRYFVRNNGHDQVEIMSERENHRFDKTPYSTYISVLENIKRIITQFAPNFSTIKAVITVPPKFTPEQRQATSLSAANVGFQVLELLDEPTAIAKSYFYKYKSLKKGEYFLVYDLGASDFKISMFKVRNDGFNASFISDYTELSGQEFDFAIFNYVCDELQRLYRCNARNDKDTIRQILIKSEEARINLSEATSSTIVLQNIVADDVTLELSRTKFEEIADSLLQQTVSFLDGFINESRVNKFFIKKIILYGGLSRTPKIQRLLSTHFRHVTIADVLTYEDTSVAEGAALKAAGR